MMVQAEQTERESGAVTAADRRQHERLVGPFDAWRVGTIDTPLRIYDVGLGGCFVNAMHEQQPGVVFFLKIHLPFGGWLALKAETLFGRAGFGYAVRFVDVPEATTRRLEQCLQHIQRGAAHDE